MKILVLTISDRAYTGVYVDNSGPAVEVVLRECMIHEEVQIIRFVVPDEPKAIKKAYKRHLDADWIITTGGTGPSVRDTAPEITAKYCTRAVPGIAEFLRAQSITQTPNAVFSRGFAGMRGKQFIVNIPGSPAAAAFCTRLLAPVLLHGTAIAHGQCHAMALKSHDRVLQNNVPSPLIH